MESSKSPNKAIIGIIVVVLLVIAATAVIALGNNKSQINTTSDTMASISPSASPTTDATNSPSATAAGFKDGTYNATGRYQTPGGSESIGVKVTLAGNVITDVAITEEGKTGEAQEYQSNFASGYKSQVVGKKINEVSLSRVAGSSLTPIGFNDAIDDIEQQAKA